MFIQIIQNQEVSLCTEERERLDSIAENLMRI